MTKIDLTKPFKEFEIEERVFKIRLDNEAITKRGEVFGEIYDDILWAEEMEDLILLYEKAFDCLFGKGSFNDIYDICEKNLYIMADLMLKISEEVNGRIDD